MDIRRSEINGGKKIFFAKIWGKQFWREKHFFEEKKICPAKTFVEQKFLGQIFLEKKIFGKKVSS